MKDRADSWGDLLCCLLGQKLLARSPSLCDCGPERRRRLDGAAFDDLTELLSCVLPCAPKPGGPVPAELWTGRWPEGGPAVYQGRGSGPDADGG